MRYRGCAVFAAFVGKCVDKRLHAGGDRLDRERLANDAGRGDDDVVCAEAGRFGEQHAHLAGDSLAVRGAGVGVAGVAEHCLRASVGDVGLGDGDGRALDGVERVDGGCGGGHVGDDEGEVLLRLVAARKAFGVQTLPSGRKVTAVLLSVMVFFLSWCVWSRACRRSGWKKPG